VGKKNQKPYQRRKKKKGGVKTRALRVGGDPGKKKNASWGWGEKKGATGNGLRQQHQLMRKTKGKGKHQKPQKKDTNSHGRPRVPK